MQLSIGPAAAISEAKYSYYYYKKKEIFLKIRIEQFAGSTFKGDLMMKLPNFEALPVLSMCMNRREAAFVLTMMLPLC
jgi:hypothetical protein